MSTEKKPAAQPATPASQPASSASDEEWAAYVLQKIGSLKYGSLQIVVHDGRIMQVEATEKIRFPSPPRTP